jgi:hypothetical protein
MKRARTKNKANAKNQQTPEESVESFERFCGRRLLCRCLNNTDQQEQRQSE